MSTSASCSLTLSSNLHTNPNGRANHRKTDPICRIHIFSRVDVRLDGLWTHVRANEFEDTVASYAADAGYEHQIHPKYGEKKLHRYSTS